jgi:hypothetical protein
VLSAAAHGTTLLLGALTTDTQERRNEWIVNI